MLPREVTSQCRDGPGHHSHLHGDGPRGTAPSQALATAGSSHVQDSCSWACPQTKGMALLPPEETTVAGEVAGVGVCLLPFGLI